MAAIPWRPGLVRTLQRIRPSRRLAHDWVFRIPALLLGASVWATRAAGISVNLPQRPSVNATNANALVRGDAAVNSSGGVDQHGSGGAGRSVDEEKLVRALRLMRSGARLWKSESLAAKAAIKSLERKVEQQNATIHSLEADQRELEADRGELRKTIHLMMTNGAASDIKQKAFQSQSQVMASTVEASRAAVKEINASKQAEEEQFARELAVLRAQVKQAKDDEISELMAIQTLQDQKDNMSSAVDIAQQKEERLAAKMLALQAQNANLTAMIKDSFALQLELRQSLEKHVRAEEEEKTAHEQEDKEWQKAMVSQNRTLASAEEAARAAVAKLHASDQVRQERSAKEVASLRAAAQQAKDDNIAELMAIQALQDQKDNISAELRASHHKENMLIDKILALRARNINLTAELNHSRAAQVELERWREKHARAEEQDARANEQSTAEWQDTTAELQAAGLGGQHPAGALRALMEEKARLQASLQSAVLQNQNLSRMRKELEQRQQTQSKAEEKRTSEQVAAEWRSASGVMAQAGIHGSNLSEALQILLNREAHEKESLQSVIQANRNLSLELLHAQAKSSSLAGALDSLQNQKQLALSDGMRALQSNNSKLAAELAESRTAREELEKRQQVALDRERKALQAQNATLASTQAEVRAAVARINASKEAEEERSAAELATLRADSKQSKDDNVAEMLAMQTLKEQNDNLSAALRHFQEEAAALQHSVTALQSNNSKLEANNTKLAAEAQESGSAKETLEQWRENHSKSEMEAHQVHERAEAARQVIEARLQAAGLGGEPLAKAVPDLLEREERLKAELDRSEQDNEKMRMQLKLSTDKGARTADDLENIQAQNEDLAERTDSLLGENRGLRGRVEQWRSRSERYRNITSGLERNLSAAEERARNLNSTLVDLAADNAKLKNALFNEELRARQQAARSATAEDMVQELSSDLEHLRETGHEVLMSTASRRPRHRGRWKRRRSLDRASADLARLSDELLARHRSRKVPQRSDASEQQSRELERLSQKLQGDMKERERVEPDESDFVTLEVPRVTDDVTTSDA